MARRAEPAFAKVNLCLHVTGRRPDGYHLLDSIAVFAGIGDRLRAEPADAISLRIDGPFGAGLDPGADNLVSRAAAMLAARMGLSVGARMVLDKRLPVASGIGGGSADAAAALRLLAALWDAPACVVAALPDLALRLGADVPVCLDSVACRMRGVGEVIDRMAVPACGLLLVNPGVAVGTSAVFELTAEQRMGWSAGLAPALWRDPADLAAWLRGTRNDLQDAAEVLCPPIGPVLQAISHTDGCLLARMSGSGATCFGLYPQAKLAEQAARAVSRPGWWCWGGAIQPDG